MGEFFRGWRRKAGIVTLFMALMLCCIWVHSYTEFTLFFFNTGVRKHWISAFKGVISWWSWDVGPAPFWADWIIVQPELVDQFLVIVDGMRSNPVQDNFRSWDIPFWCIILLLTLVSAFLIFWKPRHAPRVFQTPDT